MASKDPHVSSNTTKNAKRKAGFQKGKSGNPAGRPKGSKNKVNAKMRAALEAHSAELLKVVIEKALDGDMPAMKLCLDRISPPTKAEAINLELPPTDTRQGIKEAMDIVIRAMGNGELSIVGGEALLRVLRMRETYLEPEIVEEEPTIPEGYTRVLVSEEFLRLLDLFRLERKLGLSQKDEIMDRAEVAIEGELRNNPEAVIVEE